MTATRSTTRYYADTVYEVLRRHPAALVIIPPQSSEYGRRSLVETAMYRYKTTIDRRLQARTLPNRKTEAKIACNVLNRMTKLGMPISIRIK